MTYDKPLWFMMIGMFVVGLGLGQLMQTLVLASQNAVAPSEMGVASSSATFFRQIGGTLGTAIMLSLLFSSLPANVMQSLSDQNTLKTSLDAALDPSVANNPSNEAIMTQLWNPIVDPLKSSIQEQLDSAKTEGSSQVDWADDEQRSYWIDQVTPELSAELAKSSEASSSESSNLTSDTSFLNGADPRLSKPFMVGFTQSAITIYWVGFSVLMLAFVLSWFFKVPPLRQRSALQERADEAGTTDTGTIRTQGV
jgi:hypothetical protein